MADITITIYDIDGNPTTFQGPEKDLGELLTLNPPKYFTSADDAKRYKENQGGTTTLNDIVSGLVGGPSIPADISNYELDLLNAEYGFTNDAFDSAIQRALNKIENPSITIYTPEDFKILKEGAFDAFTSALGANDEDAAARIGSIFRLGALGLGYGVRLGSELVEETFGYLVNSIGDAFRPEAGGVADSFVDAVVGKPGQNTVSSWYDSIAPKYRYDSGLNKFIDVTNNLELDPRQLVEENKNTPITDPPITDPPITDPPITDPPIITAPTDQAFNAIGQKGPRGQSNEGYEYKFDNPPGRGLNPGVTNIGDPDPEPLERSQEIDRRTIIIYKDGESKRVDFRSLQSFLDDGWSTTKPEEEEVVVEDEQVIDDDTGTGQLVSDQLNDFNNIPKNAVLIDAGGELFLGYEVPGAYGQLYNGNPIYMLYEVLSNDVFEAGILTQGASPQVNVSLGSKQDLNQYGIIVGGTDELTDDVEHPFIRFTENFEAGKRVNPWLADTSINPNTGVTYQQEAIEFLAEQALEQFTPEETQTRYEGSDWYQKSTTQQKTWLTTVLTQPAQAEQDIQDKQIEVKAAMEANGIASPPDALVNWVADKAVTGMWTQVYTDQQIALLADPYKPGTRDTGMVNFIEGVGVGTLDRLSVGEKTVRDLYRRYLGPSLGNASDDEIAEKAGLLRSDPDAEQQLKSYLEQQRLAMFGNYTNPTLTYNDIVQPYKNLVNQVWGQEVDETQDWFIKMVQDNDIEKAYTTLREKGMEQGIERVQDQALNDLQRSIGQGQIAPQLGANT